MVCDSSEGPEYLWIIKANPAILCFLVYFQGERIDKGQGTWERRKEPRRSVTSPSGLFSSSSLRFYKRRTIYEKS